MSKKPKTKKADILTAAVNIAALSGLHSVTRAAVAAAVGCNDSLVSYHFGTMCQLRRDLMRKAVRDKNVGVVAQGLAMRHPVAQKAPEELKARARRSL